MEDPKTFQEAFENVRIATEELTKQLQIAVKEMQRALMVFAKFKENK